VFYTAIKDLFLLREFSHRWLCFLWQENLYNLHFLKCCLEFFIHLKKYKGILLILLFTHIPINLGTRFSTQLTPVAAASLILFLFSHNFQSIPGIIQPRPSSCDLLGYPGIRGPPPNPCFMRILERRALANKLFILLRPT